MKFLILTQKVDKEDPVLGFFHNWILELSKKFEKVSVICLEKGEYNLPENVRVYSLGKEKRHGLRIMNYELCKKIKYALNFFRFSFFSSLEYDAVLVHMNQEYVLLGGFIWKILRKKVYMWRNHKYGNILTALAVLLSDKVFYTSPNSYAAKYKNKSVKMPAGIDMSKFKYQEPTRKKNSILSLGRISLVKNIHLMLEVVRILEAKKIQFTFDIIGNPINPEDFEYKERLIRENQDLIDKHILNFYPAVPHYETLDVYLKHEIFINLTPSGSLDKTTLEAAAYGCIPFNIANEDVREITKDMDPTGILLPDLNPQKNASRLESWFNTSNKRKEEIRQQLKKYVSENHGLDILIDKLTNVITE